MSWKSVQTGSMTFREEDYVIDTGPRRASKCVVSKAHTSERMPLTYGKANDTMMPGDRPRAQTDDVLQRIRFQAQASEMDPDDVSEHDVHEGDGDEAGTSGKMRMKLRLMMQFRQKQKSVMYGARSSLASLASGTHTLTMKEKKKNMASRVNDAELLAVLDPLLLECPPRAFCYGVPPVYRLATMSGCTSRFVLLITYLLPLASFALDVTPVVPESGRHACIGYTAGRTALFVLLLAVSAWFVYVHCRAKLCPIWKMRQEQVFILTACLMLIFDHGLKWLQSLRASDADDACEGEFKISDWADLRFFRALNFGFNYLTLDVLQNFTTGITPIFVVFAVSLGEMVVVWEVPKPKEEEDKRAFSFDAEQWFETIRICLVAHKIYMAYMEISKRSYLRTRSRQLAFWIIAGPLGLHCLLFLGGRQFVVVLNSMKIAHELRLNAFVGEVCVTELRYLLLALLFATPSERQLLRYETHPVRIVRLECSCICGDRSKGDEQFSKRHRNNVFGDLSLETDLRDKVETLRPTFCLETALWAFNCSYLVYYDEPNSGSDSAMPQDDLDTACLQVRTFFIHHGSTNCACIFSSAAQPWRIFVSFRGTASLSHVATDIKAWGKFVQFGRDDESFWVHQGFNRAYKTVGPIIRMELHKYLQELLKCGNGADIISVTFCGHSLGGALATLMAVDCVDGLRQVGVTSINLYTFGAPRVGDRNFADFFNSKITNAFRIVGSADPVPQVPGKRSGVALMLTGLPLLLKIRSLLFGKKYSVLLFYKHVGYQVCVNRHATGDVLINPEVSDRLFFMNWLPVATDHLFTAYRAAMFASIFYLKGEDDLMDLARAMDKE